MARASLRLRVVGASIAEGAIVELRSVSSIGSVSYEDVLVIIVLLFQIFAEETCNLSGGCGKSVVQRNGSKRKSDRLEHHKGKSRVAGSYHWGRNR